jgi:hypothetical protein
MNKKKYILFLIIPMFFLIIKLNFFKNLYFIFLDSFEERISKVYGFCENEGIGYLNFVKRNFEINKKIRLINSLKRNNNNSGNWATLNTKFNEKDEVGFLVIINNNKVNYLIDDGYEVIHNYKDCYLLKIK